MTQATMRSGFLARPGAARVPVVGRALGVVAIAAAATLAIAGLAPLGAAQPGPGASDDRPGAPPTRALADSLLIDDDAATALLRAIDQPVVDPVALVAALERAFPPGGRDDPESRTRATLAAQMRARHAVGRLLVDAMNSRGSINRRTAAQALGLVASRAFNLRRHEPRSGERLATTGGGALPRQVLAARGGDVVDLTLAVFWVGRLADLTVELVRAPALEAGQPDHWAVRWAIPPNGSSPDRLGHADRAIESGDIYFGGIPDGAAEASLADLVAAWLVPGIEARADVLARTDPAAPDPGGVRLALARTQRRALGLYGSIDRINVTRLIELSAITGRVLAAHPDVGEDERVRFREESRRVGARIVALGGDNPDLLYQQARQLEAAAQVDQAAEIYRRLVRDYPDFRTQFGEPHPLIRLAEIARGGGQATEALGYYEAALRGSHGGRAAWLAAGDLAFRLRDERAMRFLDAAERAGASEPTLYLRRGKLALAEANAVADPRDQGRALLRARAEFRALIAVAPRLEDGYLRLVGALLARAPAVPGDPEGAVVVLRAGQSAIEGAAVFLKLEASIHWRLLGDAVAARAALEAYLLAVPTDAEAREELATLNQLDNDG